MTTALHAGAVSRDACPDYPEDVRTLLDVLAYQCQQMPDRPICHRIVRRGRVLDAEPLTVHALGVRATAAATALRAAGIRDGDRVLVSLSDPHDFVVAFFASLIAGARAVPLPTTAEAGAPRSFAARVRGVTADCAPALAVVEDRERFARVVGTLPRHVTMVEPADLADGREPEVRLPRRAASAPAFIQYTSGSTGAPKGVVVTHGNVLANCRAIRDATAYSRADRMVSWLPLHHDMGFVGGLLTSIYCAAETWLLPPLVFLARPVTWLEAITAFCASLTVAPTFAYRLCARKIPAKQLARVDLSTLRLAYVGAEPVDRGTVQAFVDRFGPYGLRANAMYPVYGLAEATLAVTFPAPGSALRCDTVDRSRLARDRVAVPAEDGADAVTFVSVGQALPGHRVTICDDTGAPLPDRRLGELVVTGPSVSPGYYTDGALPPRVTLRTADLAYVADGHLYVVDRIKDLVIVRGQNYAPSDIERAATVEGLRPGRIVAFSQPAACGDEEVHLVAEASPHAWRAPGDVAAEARMRVLRDVGLAVASVTIVAPGSLERTSSGKVRRRACAEAHAKGTLHVLRTRWDVLACRARRRANRLRRFAVR